MIFFHDYVIIEKNKYFRAFIDNCAARDSWYKLHSSWPSRREWSTISVNDCHDAVYGDEFAAFCTGTIYSCSFVPAICISVCVCVEQVVSSRRAASVPD